MQDVLVQGLPANDLLDHFFFGFSSALSVLLEVNFIRVEAAMFTGSPVCGLRPVRAADFEVLNEPKPGHAIFSSF